MKDIYIYGEVVPPFITGSGYCTLRTVSEQLRDLKGEDIRVRLNCVGGDVNEGFAIYSELRRYAQENNAKVTTLAEGMCASIATVIFLAGDHRIMNEYTEPFVHNAFCYTSGDGGAIQKVADELEKVNNMIAKHYEAHTDLSYEDARTLMESESFISTDDCLALRFAHEIEIVARPVNVILKTNKMNKKPVTNSLFRRFKNALGISNKIVYDADQRELDFYELEDSDSVSVGDKATIDGKPAGESGEDGKITMANGEVYVFDGEELMEIIPVDAGEDTTEASLSAEETEEVLNLLESATNKIKTLRAQNKTLKEENEVLKAKNAKYENLKQDFQSDKDQNPGKGEKGTNKVNFGNSIDKLTNRKK